MQKRIHFDNILVISSLVTAILLYSGLAGIRNTGSVKSLLDFSCIECIEGQLSGDAVPYGSGKYFYSYINPSSFIGKIGACEVKSSASGRIRILIPEGMAASFMPYSLSFFYGKEPFLLEKGLGVKVYGKWSEKVDGFIVTDIENKGYSGFAGVFFRERERLRLNFYRLMVSLGRAGSLLLSLFAGFRYYLGNDASLLFRKAGCSHILALSGMHLGFFAMMPGVLKKPFGKRAVHILSMVFILCFVFFAGPTPSLVRALMFFIILYVLNIFSVQESRPEAVLGAVFMLHVVLFPEDFNTVSFNLSYGAMAGLVILGPLLEGLVSPYMASSLGAFLFTAPLCAFYFGSIYPVSILSSVLIGFLITVFMSLGAGGTLICLLLPFLNGVFSCILNALYDVIMKAAGFFSCFPAIEFD